VPIYEYSCPDCGHSFERLQSLQELPEALCPNCGGPAQKVMSASVAYIMKGAGLKGSGHSANDKGPCCGHASPCESPKRCCTK
jgi:putative FmdB family regulatory protein